MNNSNSDEDEDPLDPMEEARMSKKLGKLLGVMGQQSKSKDQFSRGLDRPRGKQPVESNPTVVVYMVNLVFMIIMSLIIMGVLIIYSFVLLEGSQQITPWLLVHLITPALSLGLNLYVMTLEDRREYVFFRQGLGTALMNLSIGISTLMFVGTMYFKFGRGERRAEEEPEFAEAVLNVEECSMYAISVLLSLTLKKYSEYKLEDLIRHKKRINQ
jgi:cation transport ATPase